MLDSSVRWVVLVSLVLPLSCSDDPAGGDGGSGARDGAESTDLAVDARLDLPPRRDGSRPDHTVVYDDFSGPDAPPADGRPGPDGSSPFMCGPRYCEGTFQYCKKTAPGVCGGQPVPDAGSCPAGCTPTTCPGGANVCLCSSYSCESRPAGCSDCRCLTGLPSSCSCTKDARGHLTVQCASP